MLTRTPIVMGSLATIATLGLLSGTANAGVTPNPGGAKVHAHSHEHRRTGGSGDTESGDQGGAPSKIPPCPKRTACGAIGGPQPAGHVATVDVVHSATDSLYLPTPHIRTSPNAKSFVNVKTYLWVAPGGWETKYAKARVPGQTVSAEARPTKIVWNTGEGTVTCTSPRKSRSCAHTYKHSSAAKPGGKYRVTATITWSITWTCAGTCDSAGGTLPAMTSSSSIAFPVGEVQTTNGG